MDTKIQNYIQLTKNTFESQIKGDKSIGSMVYWTFKSIIHKDNEVTRRFEQLGYKVLDRFPLSGEELLKAFITPHLVSELKIWKKKDAPYRSRHPIQMRVDGTKGGRKYGKYIPELQNLYNYVEGNYIHTHDIYVLLVSIGEKDFVVGFLFHKKEDDLGINAIVQCLLTDLIDQVGGELGIMLKRYGRVSLDGAWGNGKMLTWLYENHFYNIAIKSSGKDNIRDNQGNEYSLKDFERMHKDILDDSFYQDFNPCHRLKRVVYYKQDVTLVSSGLEIQLIFLKYPAKKKKQKDRYLLLITFPHDRWYPFQVVQTYKWRWSIEVLFRTAKQHWGWDKYSFHSKSQLTYPSKDAKKEWNDDAFADSQMRALDRIKRYLVIRLMGYMVMDWYRVTHTRQSITPLKKVRERWANYFDQLHPKTLLKIFAG